MLGMIYGVLVVSFLKWQICLPCSLAILKLMNSLESLDCWFHFPLFSKQGTPNDSIWPGVTELPDWKSTFPNWKQKKLSSVCPKLDAQGLDLLTVLFLFLFTLEIDSVGPCETFVC